MYFLVDIIIIEAYSPLDSSIKPCLSLNWDLFQLIKLVKLPKNLIIILKYDTNFLSF